MATTHSSRQEMAHRASGMCPPVKHLTVPSTNQTCSGRGNACTKPVILPPPGLVIVCLYLPALYLQEVCNGTPSLTHVPTLMRINYKFKL